jgi:hypothetical protein
LFFLDRAFRAASSIFSGSEAAELKASAQPTATPTVKARTPKKITITCVKGKTSKKVTDVSPKCPAGNKKK